MSRMTSFGSSRSVIICRPTVWFDWERREELIVFEVSCDVVDAVTPHEVQNSDLSHSHGAELFKEPDTHHLLPSYNVNVSGGFKMCYGSSTVLVYWKASQ